MIVINRVTIDLGRIIVDRPKGSPVSEYSSCRFVEKARNGINQLAAELGGVNRINFLKGLRKEDPNPLMMQMEASSWLAFNLAHFPVENYLFAYRESKWEACCRVGANCHIDDRIEVFASFPNSLPIVKILFDPDMDELIRDKCELIDRLIYADDDIRQNRSRISEKIILITKDQGWPRINRVIKMFRPQTIEQANLAYASERRSLQATP